MNAALTNPGFTLERLRPSELAKSEQTELSWLWHGYLARGKLTALISPPKSGKTTLAARLLASFAQGGAVAGLAVAPARVIVVSEESAADWGARCRQLGMGQHIEFVCRPFRGARPTEAQWLDFIARLSAVHRQEGFDLLVLDTLATLLPGYAESSAPKLLDCLLPLQDLAQGGAAVWVLHHPAKGKRADGQAARGSGALAGFADIIMEMACVRRARSLDRRRRISAYSRYAETPRQLIIEWSADGAEYFIPIIEKAKPVEKPWPEVDDILANASAKLDQRSILEHWPAECSRPNRSTLWRWLQRAVARGHLRSSGSGQRGDNFLYWLPSREPLLFPGPGASQEDKQAWKDRWTAESRRLFEQMAPPRISASERGLADPAPSEDASRSKQ